jgi:hypothetical protein
VSILLAVNDGIANNHWNEADACFLGAAILAVLAAIAYGMGIGTVARPDSGPDKRSDATTATPVTGTPTPAPSTVRGWRMTIQHYRFHEIAAALLALAVAATAFGLFLQ